jgi:hypothetical protein
LESQVPEPSMGKGADSQPDEPPKAT